MKKAIYSIAVGETYLKLADITVPIMKQYALDTDCDFFLYSEADLDEEYVDPYCLKYKGMRELNEYDRLLFLDIDVYIKTNSPNIFDIYANSGMRPTPTTPPHNADLDALFKFCHEHFDDVHKVFKECPYYYNTGVIIFNRKDLDIINENFKPPYVKTHFADTWLLNYYFYKFVKKIDDFHYFWNYNPSVRGYEEFNDAYFVEYCRSGVDNRIFKMLERDMKEREM